MDKLNLMALGGFLYQLKKASQSQLFHSVTDTVDYSLAMPGNSFPEETAPPDQQEVAQISESSGLPEDLNPHPHPTRSPWLRSSADLSPVFRRAGDCVSGNAAATAAPVPTGAVPAGSAKLRP